MMANGRQALLREVKNPLNIRGGRGEVAKAKDRA
jgi:hypothetical protein